jgi:hypothetical protein
MIALSHLIVTVVATNVQHVKHSVTDVAQVINVMLVHYILHMVSVVVNQRSAPIINVVVQVCVLKTGIAPGMHDRCLIGM